MRAALSGSAGAKKEFSALGEKEFDGPSNATVHVMWAVNKTHDRDLYRRLLLLVFGSRSSRPFP